MYSLRYHIASLAAVFLALALGLVLGGLVVRQSGFDAQQAAIVTSLQDDFDALKKTNSSLKSQLAEKNAYSQVLTTGWVRGRMADRSVIVVTSGATDEGADSAASAIKDAGGTPVVVRLLKPQFGLEDAAVAAAVGSVVGSSTDLAADIPAVLAAEWSQPADSRPLTDALMQTGAITVAGLTPQTGAVQAIDLAAFEGKPDKVALAVAQAYGKLGFTAVGAQQGGSNTGVAAAAAALGLSSFDSLGTDEGRYTLVALLTGGAQGVYSSTLAGADPYPAVPFP